MKRKLFGVALCVMLLVGVLALSVSATGIITSVTVTELAEPVPDARMSFDVTLDPDSNFDLMQDGRLIFWVDEETGTRYTDNQIAEFVVGKVYTIQIYIEAESGYTFPDNLENVSVTVNGVRASLKYDQDNDAYFIQARFDPCGSVENIEISCVAPVVGQEPRFDKVVNYRYTSTGSVSPRVNGVSWYDETARKYIYKGTGQKFESHHIYTVTFGLESEMYTVQTAHGNVDKYYEFTGNTSATVNGKPVASVDLDLYENDGNWIWANVKYTFGETGCAPEFVQGEFPSCSNTGHVGYYACSCGKWYWDKEATEPIADKEEIVIPPTGAHTYKSVTTKATLTKNGKVESKCSVCGNIKSTKTIYYPKTISLSATKYLFDGKTKTPTLTVKGSNDKALVKGTDYKIEVASKRTAVGKYAVKITFMGNYSGTKTLYFYILPNKTSKVTATQNTSAILAKWNKVTGADGYAVEIYDSNNNKLNTKYTTALQLKYSGLKAGTAYKIKVIAYKTIDGKKVLSTVGTVLTTATAPAKPTLKATSTKGKVSLSWTNVAGETGYVIQYSTKKDSGFKKLTDTKANVVSYSKNATGGKTYYFRVKSYKKVGDSYVYSEYSDVKGIKIKPSYSVEISGTSATIYVGKTKQLKATTYPADKSVTWKSSDTSVATVSSAGKVTAKSAGTATITVSFKYSGKTYTDTYKITVKKYTSKSTR